MRVIIGMLLAGLILWNARADEPAPAAEHAAPGECEGESAASDAEFLRFADQVLPAYALVTMADYVELSPEAAAAISAEISEDAAPWMARGDFDGNGREDAALLMKTGDGQFHIVALHHEGDSFVHYMVQQEMGSGFFGLAAAPYPDTGQTCIQTRMLGGSVTGYYCWTEEGYTAREVPQALPPMPESASPPEDTAPVTPPEEPPPPAAAAPPPPPEGRQSGFAGIVLGEDVAAILEKLSMLPFVKDALAGLDAPAEGGEPAWRRLIAEEAAAKEESRPYLEGYFPRNEDLENLLGKLHHLRIPVELPPLHALTLAVPEASDIPLFYIVSLRPRQDDPAETFKDSAEFQQLVKKFGEPAELRASGAGGQAFMARWTLPKEEYRFLELPPDGTAGAGIICVDLERLRQTPGVMLPAP